MDIFPYGAVEIEYLAGRDAHLAKAMEQIGIVERPVIRDVFKGLVYNIVSQQISTKAAQTVWGRLQDLAGEISVKQLAQLGVEHIRGCGMSGRKAVYIEQACLAVQQGRIDLDAMIHMSDNQVIRQLTALPGIGVWTAEMLLLFTFCRRDVVSLGDLGIRKGMVQLYGVQELSREQMEYYRQVYSPYGSTASLYLWELAKNT